MRERDVAIRKNSGIKICKLLPFFADGKIKLKAFFESSSRKNWLDYGAKRRIIKRWRTKNWVELWGKYGYKNILEHYFCPESCKKRFFFWSWISGVGFFFWMMQRWTFLAALSIIYMHRIFWTMKLFLRTTLLFSC